MTRSAQKNESLSARLRRLLIPALEALAPSRCAACGAELPQPGLFCAGCSAEPTYNTPDPDLQVIGVPVLALGRFDGSLRRAITRFKYENHPELAAPLAAALWVHLSHNLLSMGCSWVPVPLHPKRLADRGYNQSALLAQELARCSGSRALPRALRRVGNTRQQARLSRQERKKNLSAQIAAGTLGPGQEIVLVDDVLTTGSTAQACIEAIRAAGAEARLVVTLAFAPFEESRN